MTKRTPRALFAVPLAAAFVFGACGPISTVEDPSVTARVAAVGRISDIEVNHGYAIVEFPTGRMNVSMDRRELEGYIVGDEIRIDSFGRPLPRRR